MELNIFDKDFNRVGVLDTLSSFIWTERFNGFGDFELYTSFSLDLLAVLAVDYYMKIRESDRTMIIESIEIKSDAENGDKLLVRGRSLESILDRRIVLAQTIIDNMFLQDALELLLNDNVIDSSQPNRNIPDFIFEASANPVITALTLTAQYDGENIYDVVDYLSKKEDFGYKVILNESNQFVFSLYLGEDRSYNQSTNPFVVFSPDFDNLLNSNYIMSKRYYKTYSLVFGETKEWRVEAFIPGGTLLTGLNRREILTDAKDLSTSFGGGTIDPADYHLQLKERGYETLASNRFFVLLDGETDITKNFKYGTDFFLGDTVQIEDKYGNTGEVILREVTFSEDPSGFKVIPTFESI